MPWLYLVGLEIGAGFRVLALLGRVGMGERALVLLGRA